MIVSADGSGVIDKLGIRRNRVHLLAIDQRPVGRVAKYHVVQVLVVGSHRSTLVNAVSDVLVGDVIGNDDVIRRGSGTANDESVLVAEARVVGDDTTARGGPGMDTLALGTECQVVNDSAVWSISINAVELIA